MENREGSQNPAVGAASVKDILKQAIQDRKRSGLVPYEGQWLPREAVREKLKVEEKKSIGRAAELVVFFVLVLFMSALLVSLLWSLVY